MAKHCKEAAQEALRKGKVVACRFWFFHVLVFTYICTILVGISQMITKCVRRIGKTLVETTNITSTNDHTEFCKPILQRDTPFRSASTDVGQNWGRRNIDLHFMPRTLDPDPLFNRAVLHNLLCSRSVRKKSWPCTACECVCLMNPCCGDAFILWL